MKFGNVKKELKVRVVNDFFMNVKRQVFTEIPVKDVVALADIFRNCMVSAFGEESYYGRLKDLSYSYDNPKEAWPEWAWIPLRPPEDEKMKKIWEQYRMGIKRFGKVVKEYVDSGYKFRIVRFVEDKSIDCKYDRPYESWTFSEDGDIILVKF